MSERGRRSDVPEWARRHDASAHPCFGYTADVVGFRADVESGGELRVLLVVRGESGPYAGMRAWPGGFVDWSGDVDGRAAAVRELEEETGLSEPDFLETLGIYDTNGRDPRQHVDLPDGGSDRERPRGTRVVSRAHLGLFGPDAATPRPAAGEDAARADWIRAYDFVPWEDHRTGASLRRARAAFGSGAGERDPTACGERFRTLLRAGLVEEAHRDRWGRVPRDPRPEPFFGEPLAFDHREMLVDGLGRLRDALRRRPADVLGALAGPDAARDDLAAVAGAILGRTPEDADVRWPAELRRS